jgi:TRAP-type C4-dicarboxylate transport system substrate-binding protein
MKKIALAVAFACAAQTGAAEEVELKFATVTPATAASVREFYVPWTEKVNEQGKGVVKIDLRPGPTLATSNTAYARLVNDVVQIVYTLFTYVSGKFPHSEVAALPVSDSAEHASVALWRLYKSGMVDAEFDETHPLMFISLPQSVLHLATAPKTLDNLQGLKLIAPGRITASVTSKLGATPLTLTTAQIYESLQRGVADGATVTWNAYQIFKFAEVTKFHVDVPLGSAAGMVFMGKKRYGALPEAARKVIDANSGEATTRAYGKFWEDDDNKGRAEAKADSRRTVAQLNPQQQAHWAAKVQQTLDEWVQQTPGGDKVLARYKALLADVKAGK